MAATATNALLQEFLALLSQLEKNANNKELRRKKKVLQEAIFQHMLKNGIPYVQLGPSLFLVRAEKQVLPKLSEEFLVKAYGEFIRTQKNLIQNPLAFAKFVSYCQNCAAKKKIVSCLTKKIPDTLADFNFSSSARPIATAEKEDNE